MNNVFYIIKIVTISQVILLFLLVIIMYLIKLITHFSRLKNVKTVAYLEETFKKYSHKFDSLQPKDLKNYLNHVPIMIPLIKKYDDVIPQGDWKKVRIVLINEIILPFARKLVASKQWVNRYLASQAFQLTLQPDDQPFVEQLLNDTIPLIALNAVKIVLEQPSQILINRVIIIFSKNRRFQNALFSQSIQVKPHAAALITVCLNNSIDIYEKILCYRMLSEQSHYDQNIKTIQEDLNATNIDLQIAALTYVAYTDPKRAKLLLSQKLQNPHWEIRTIAAKLVGQIRDISSLTQLARCLHDSQWWVRINAAEALAQLGPPGIEILKQQTPEVDQYAYDTAKRVLETYFHGVKHE